MIMYKNLYYYLCTLLIKHISNDDNDLEIKSPYNYLSFIPRNIKKMKYIF